jgi:preprotein translocase subunit SecD
MRRGIAAVALLSAFAAACSSGGSADSSRTPSSPQPTSTYTQLGTLAISHVLDFVRIAPGSDCATASEAFPNVRPSSDKAVACYPRGREMLLLAPPVLDQTAVEATTVAREPDGGTWTVYIQLSKSGARAFAEIGGRYAVVYNRVVVNTAPAVTPGGFVQVTGLSKHKAKRIAKALNPS